MKESTSLAKCPLRQVWRQGLGQHSLQCPGMAVPTQWEAFAHGSYQRVVHWKTSPSGHVRTAFSPKIPHATRGTGLAVRITAATGGGLTQGKEHGLRAGRLC